jgi:hypothetical protein
LRRNIVTLSVIVNPFASSTWQSVVIAGIHDHLRSPEIRESRHLRRRLVTGRHKRLLTVSWETDRTSLWQPQILLDGSGVVFIPSANLTYRTQQVSAQ